MRRRRRVRRRMPIGSSWLVGAERAVRAQRSLLARGMVFVVFVLSAMGAERPLGRWHRRCLVCNRLRG
jgi:hypothetical protein